jgi:hypothetical protein
MITEKKECEMRRKTCQEAMDKTARKRRSGDRQRGGKRHQVLVLENKPEVTEDSATRMDC